jgi:hypothetical protein
VKILLPQGQPEGRGSLYLRERIEQELIHEKRDCLSKHQSLYNPDFPEDVIIE